jgi:hypothetical protein
MKLDSGMHIDLHLVFFGKTSVTGEGRAEGEDGDGDVAAEDDGRQHGGSGKDTGCGAEGARRPVAARSGVREATGVGEGGRRSGWGGLNRKGLWGGSSTPTGWVKYKSRYKWHDASAVLFYTVKSIV